MAGYQKHIFICENLRDAKTGRPSCGRHQTSELRSVLKRKIKELGYTQKYRVSSSGCLGHCEHGPLMVIYPQGFWYSKFTKNDMDEIIAESLEKENQIAKLQIK